MTDPSPDDEIKTAATASPGDRRVEIPGFSAPDIVFENGVPISKRHDDPYYSREDGLAESQFTFLDGNALDQRWIGQSCFTIAETGFGTGLNFLAVLDRFQQSEKRPKNLRFISVEAYPLRSAQIHEAHQAFPSLTALSAHLLAILPPPEPGIFSRRLLDGAVELVLMHGEAGAMLPRIKTPVDAWFLDGFAPARNPDMWRADVFAAMAAKTAHNGTLATFTAAGFVRRGLESAGFDMAKKPGFGRKRERLVGRKRAQLVETTDDPKPPRSQIGPDTPAQKIAIIGAGLAGLTLAQALETRGASPLIFDIPHPAGERPKEIEGEKDGVKGLGRASDVPVALIAPRFHLNRAQPQARFIAQAYAAAAVYAPYQEAAMKPHGTVMRPGGTADLDRLKKMKATFNWGDDWISDRDDGLFLPRSLAIETATLLPRMRDGIRLHQGHVSGLSKGSDGSWQLQGAEQFGAFDQVIIATGAAPALTGYLAPNVRPVPGHVAQFDSDQLKASDGITTALVGDKYLSPASEVNLRTLGATIEKSAPLQDPAAALLAASVGVVDQQSIQASPLAKRLWHGVRATIADHMPLVGALAVDRQTETHLADIWVKDDEAVDSRLTAMDRLAGGLYAFFGFGSKGFQYCPLAADMLADRLLGISATSTDDMPLALEPCRFAARLTRKQAQK